MLQRPWLAWFISHTAAAVALLAWGDAMWFEASPALLRCAFWVALPGAALAVGARVGRAWAGPGGVSAILMPICLMQAMLTAASLLLHLPAQGVAGALVLVACASAVATGQAGMLAALVQPSKAHTAPPAWDLGQALGYALAAAATGAGLWRLAAANGLAPVWALGGAAFLWSLAAALFFWMHKTAPTPAAVPTAGVSMASLLRARRWPLVGVAALCGALAACTPVLWLQSLQCLRALPHTTTFVPILMLLGYGAGAKVASSVAQRPATVRLALTVTLLGCAAFYLLGMIHFDTLPRHLVDLDLLSDAHMWRRTTLQGLLTAWVVLPVSISTGACLPLVAGAVAHGAPAAAHRMNRTLCAYGLGMLATGLLLPAMAPYVDLEASLRAAALLYTLAALVCSNAATPQRKIVRGLHVTALAMALTIAIWPRWTVRDIVWPHFGDAQAARGDNGLHWFEKSANMRPHASMLALSEDQGPS